MTRRLPLVLGGVLAVQLVLAVALAAARPDTGAFEAAEPLLAFDPEAVDAITISDADGQSVTLERREGAWTVADLYDFPGDAAKADDFLNQLAELRKGWPVASTRSAAERFKVAEESYERRITLRAGDKEAAELFLGSSPTFRQSHVRAAGESDVFSVELAAFDAPARAIDWADRRALAVRENDITRIELDEVTLEREDDAFVVAGLEEGEETDADEARRLARAAANPSFETLLGRGEDARADLGDPVARVTLILKDGETKTYRVYEGDTEDYVTLVRDDLDFVFRTRRSSVRPLLDASPDTLIRRAEAEEAEEADAPENAGERAEAPSAEEEAVRGEEG